MFIGNDFEPKKIELNQKYTSEDIKKVSDFVNLSAVIVPDSNALVFSLKQLETKPPSTEKWLEKRGEVFFDDEVFSSHGPIESKIRQEIFSQLPSGDCTKQSVAEALGFTERTFHNYLSRNSLNYKTLLNNVRKEQALRLLRNKNLSLSQVAFELGFSNQSSFSRSFKGWFNISPKVFRKKMTFKYNFS